MSFSFNPFSLWAALPCYVISFNYNTMFVHCLEWDCVLLLLLSLHFCCYGLEGPFGTILLWQGYPVQYLFICCLLFKLMKKASFGFWISFVSKGNLFSSWEEKEDTLKRVSPHQGPCPLWDTLRSTLAGVVSAPRLQSHSAGSAVLSCGAGLFLSMTLVSC